jgi:hypothetical protein
MLAERGTLSESYPDNPDYYQINCSHCLEVKVPYRKDFSMAVLFLKDSG